MDDESKFFSEAFGAPGPDEAPGETQDQDKEKQDEAQDQEGVSPEDQATGTPEPQGQDPAEDTGEQSGEGPGEKQSPRPEEGKPADQDREEDLDTLKKKAHGYESMLGRLQREQEERRKLEQRLAQIEAGRQHPADQGQARPQPPAQGGQGVTDIPPEIKEDVALFEKDFPEYSKLIHESGPDGERLRKRLKDVGPEVTAAMAEGISARRIADERFARLEQDKIQERAAVERQQAADYQDRLLGEVPREYAELRTSEEKAAELEKYHRDLREWVENKPYREARQLEWTFKECKDPRTVAAALKQFQNETRYFGEPEKPDTRPRKETVQAAAQAAAVPSRSQGVPRGKPDPHDEYSAYREAFGGK